MTTPIERAIDLACGHDPASHEIKNDGDVEMLLEMAAASIAWWHSLAAVETLENHLRNPLLNCERDEEQLLAKKVATMVKRGW